MESTFKPFKPEDSKPSYPILTFFVFEIGTPTGSYLFRYYPKTNRI